MKIAIAGNGAFGTQHMKATQNIPDIEVISLTGGRPAGTRHRGQRRLAALPAY